MIKRVGFGILAALIAWSTMVSPALAIDLPDSTPTVDSVNVFRNILETGDMLIIIKENTPYATTPDIGYSDAYIWRLIDTDASTELAQALGFEYNEMGYGYNIISFYLTASEVTSLGIVWEDPLHLRLSGTPSAFASPPIYNFDIVSSDYSSETDSVQVQIDIADLVIYLAQQFNNFWGTTAATNLLEENEAATTLSPNGQAFFRGAIFGIQSMAPTAFPLQTSDVDVTDRTWDTSYSTNLSGQHAGNYIGNALTAGGDFLDSTYNLFGLILIIGLCIVLVIGHWWLGGGNLMRGIQECVPVLVIGARIGLIGLGEVGLVAAIMVLYSSAKFWRMI